MDLFIKTANEISSRCPALPELTVIKLACMHLNIEEPETVPERVEKIASAVRDARPDFTDQLVMDVAWSQYAIEKDAQMGRILKSIGGAFKGTAKKVKKHPVFSKAITQADIEAGTSAVKMTGRSGPYRFK